jgi:hypothetical protein
MKLGDLVIVSWYDAYSVDGWQHAEDIREDKTKAIVKTVGWLVASDKTHTVLTMQRQPGTDRAGGTMLIPTRCVESITHLGSKHHTEDFDA